MIIFSDFTGPPFHFPFIVPTPLWTRRDEKTKIHQLFLHVLSIILMNYDTTLIVLFY